MHFVIVGAGALGSILAAHLARAGHGVQLLARGERARDIQAHGVRLIDTVEFNQACAVVTDPGTLKAAEVLINTVKTYQTREALARLSRLRVETAFSVQNGVMKNEQLAEVFGPQSVLGAMADVSGELLSSGAVAFTRNIMLHIGEPAGGASERAQRVATAINEAGVNARQVDNITSIEWSKFSGWVAVMLLSVLTRLETWRFLKDPNSAEIVAAITREMIWIAKRLNIPLVDMAPIPVSKVLDCTLAEATRAVQAVGQRFFEQAPQHRMSSLQDVLRGRRLEVEETAGFAVAKARELGLSTPSLDICYRAAAAVNAGLNPPA